MPDENARTGLSVVILGTDAVLAAAPATPVQLAHACLAAGYAAVVPASWGDELIATECLRRVSSRGREPAVCAACPRVTDRLLASGAELAPFAVSLVAPPVAAARYLRAMVGDDHIRVTFIGACPGADDESVDERILPGEFLGQLADRGIIALDQPQVFDSIIPPDRRRFQSLPGGVPTPEALWAAGGRTLIEIDDEDYVTELAQRLIGREHALLDIAPKLGCACSGAVADVAPRSARVAVAALEPPRSAVPVIDTTVPVDLVRSLPAAPRRRDVVRPSPAEPRPAAPVHPALMREGAPARATPADAEPRERPPAPEELAATASPGARRRTSGGSTTRAVIGAVPTVNSGEGRALPRAYVARRRSGRTPPDNAAIRPDGPKPVNAERERPIEASVEPARWRAATASADQVARFVRLPAGARARLDRIGREPKHLAVLILAVIVASMLVGVVAGRLLPGTPDNPASTAGTQQAPPDSARARTDEIPADRTVERGGAVGPELRPPEAAARPRQLPRTRRAVPDASRATARRGAAATPLPAAPPQPEPIAAPTDSAARPAAAAPATPTPAPPTPAASRQDSIERELRAIARELELRRARLDSIARRDSLRTRPPP